MAVLTINQHIDSVDSFVKNVETSDNAYYLFVARPTAWSNNDTNVLTADDSIYQYESSIYNDLVFGKLITPSDIEYITKRHDWVNGTVYDTYDPTDADLFSKSFYVVTDERKVFKVIDNGGGVPSTVKPTLTTTSGTFSTVDGYVWKYMYTFDITSNTNFASSNFIPVVPNTAVSSGAVGGTVDVIKINNPGSGYPYNSGFIQAQVTNNVVKIESSNNLINDYYTGCSMYLMSGYGAGQVRKIKRYDAFNNLVTLESQFDITAEMGLSNLTGNSNFVVGNKVTQNVEIMSLLYTIGSFQVGDTIIQSDTNASATIVTQSSNTLKILRTSANGFSINVPIRNSLQAGTLKSGTVNITSGSAYVNAVANTNFTTDYAIGDFIRVGTNANNNIRRVVAVNSTVVTVNTNFSHTAVSNSHYSVPYAAQVSDLVYDYKKATIANTNLSSIKLTYLSPSTLGRSFTVGEKIDMTDGVGVSQGIYGTVSFSNTSTVYISDITGGSFSTGYYLSGESSLLSAEIDTVDSYPNIIVNSPNGQFTTGFPISIRGPAISDVTVLATANLISYTSIPNQLTQYVISPTVTITGDGTGAKAYSVVDETSTSIGGIERVVVFDPGSGYTEANVVITSNTTHGSAASATSVISPSSGHGYDAISELGARYAAVTVNIDNAENESYRFPIYGKYRRVGIIKNPLFDDVTVNLGSFDKATLTLTGVTNGPFQAGEIVYQANTKAAALIEEANNTHMFLKTVRGTFSANGKYANGASSNDNIVGFTSGASANVNTSSVNYFKILPASVEVVSEVGSGANGEIVQIASNTQIKLTNVYGRFKANDTIFDSQTNAYANVVSIYVANGSIDATNNFAKKFNQTLRIPLSSQTGNFIQFEKVVQDTTNAYGTVISNNNEYDLAINATTGTFNVGNFIRNSTNTANGYVTFANSSYLRVTRTSGTFSNSQTIINNLNIQANVVSAYKTLVLTNIGGPNKFQSGNFRIRGANSGTIALSEGTNAIKFPELVKNTGEVIYLENVAPFELSNTSKEVVKLVIKF